MKLPILAQAQAAVLNREPLYGPARQNFDLIAKRWSLVVGVGVTPEQVALMLIDLKLARLSHDPTHVDSIIDVAGYAACLDAINRPYPPVDVE